VKIDRDEARRIASLAHLEFDDASLDRIAGEMTQILGYVERLRDAAVGDAEARESTPMREDEMRPGTGREHVERNAPEFENGFFVVPKVIE
jgi:aspartyl-tRNA(Asn)/glutamyl-tRNA(Gln) amidotransferase subunit C